AWTLPPPDREPSRFAAHGQARAHLGTTTGPRLCPKDQPQQVRMPKVAEWSPNAWPRRAAAAGAPHTALRFCGLLVVVPRCARGHLGGRVGLALPPPDREPFPVR